MDPRIVLRSTVRCLDDARVHIARRFDSPRTLLIAPDELSKFDIQVVRSGAEHTATNEVVLTSLAVVH